MLGRPLCQRPQAFQVALVGRPCPIIRLVHPGSVAGLGHQLHYRLEEINIEAKEGIEPVQHLQGSRGGVAVIAHQPAHYGPVLLLHMTAVVLLVGAGAGEGNPLPLAIGIKVLVDELTAIIRVQSQQRERQTLPNELYRRPYPLLALSPNPYTFRPPTGYIHGAQGGQIEALRTLSAVGYKVYLQEAGALLLPVGKGTDWDGVLKQAPRLGGGKGTTPSQPPPGAQQPVDGRGAHLAKLGFHLSRHGPVAMSSQDPDQLRQEGVQALGTQAVGGFPGCLQPLPYPRAITLGPSPPLSWLGLIAPA